jgi:hypothetical protein
MTLDRKTGRGKTADSRQRKVKNGMKIGGIDYGVESPWEIDVPDDAIIVENTAESRISPALTDVPQAIREAIRNPLGARPLADQVNSSSKVALILNDWMGISVHAVPIVLEELRAAGVGERNVRMVIAGGLHPKVSREQLYLSKVGQNINPPYRRRITSFQRHPVRARRTGARRGDVAVTGVSPAWPEGTYPYPRPRVERGDIQGWGILLHDAFRERCR